MAISWSEASQLITALAAVGGLIVSFLNRQKIEVVHKATNGMAARNEAIAKKLGVEEGKAAEKANPTT